MILEVYLNSIAMQITKYNSAWTSCNEGLEN